MNKKIYILLSLLFFLGFMGLIVVPSGQAALSFQSADIYPLTGTAYGPHSIIGGDFNGDSNIDLVIVNAVSHNFSFLPGNGGGTFPISVNNAVGYMPFFVESADFNGDGNLDLVIVDYGGWFVSIILGNGDGTFHSEINYEVGPNPRSLSMGDFNNDGKIDLAVINSSGADMCVLFGNGDGTFQNAINYDAEINPTDITVGDFNEDGNLDIAMVNGTNFIFMLMGNGDGTFKAPLILEIETLFPDFNLIINGDFNKDGKPDLVVGHSGGVSLLLGKGDFKFHNPVHYFVAMTPRVIKKGDFDGDGKLDLVIGNGFQVSILLGNDDGTFKSSMNFDAGIESYALYADDFNGDDKIDLAIVDYNSTVNYMSVLINNSTHSLSGIITKLNRGGVVKGVKVILNGVINDITTTDFYGRYAFSDLPNGNYTMTPCKKGYAFNPAFTNIIVGAFNLSNQNFTASLASYTISGKVTRADGKVFKGVTVTLTGGGCTFTAVTNLYGKYNFKVPNGIYGLSAAMTGFTFTPANINVTVNGANQTGRNFQQQ